VLFLAARLAAALAFGCWSSEGPGLAFALACAAPRSAPFPKGIAFLEVQRLEVVANFESPQVHPPQESRA